MMSRKVLMELENQRKRTIKERFKCKHSGNHKESEVNFNLKFNFKRKRKYNNFLSKTRMNCKHSKLDKVSEIQIIDKGNM